jgi:hypothetical protein
MLSAKITIVILLNAANGLILEDASSAMFQK